MGLSCRSLSIEHMDTANPSSPSIVLVPGHWLGAWAWDAVADELRQHGHQVTAVTLPGLVADQPDRASTTLVQQAEALRSAVHAAAADGSSVVLVAHSGAGFPVSVLLDHEPAAVAQIGRAHV
jgi:pimeloyl-ACP methyl ester carboxylesterase